MTEEQTKRELGLMRAADEGIHFAVNNNESRHAALGRMIQLLEKYGVEKTNADDALHYFEERLNNSQKGRELYDD